MIIEKITGKLTENTQNKQIETVPFEWFERHNKILKKTSSVGEEIGLRLSEPLYDGGIVFEDEVRTVVLSLNPCELTRIAVSSMKEMGRLCFELGNRHLPLALGEDSVCTPFDNPTFEYLQKLGFHCERITDKFTPEVTGLGHTHG